MLSFESMSDRPKGQRKITASGSLIALAMAAGLLFGIASPGSAQLFNFGFPQQPPPQRGFGGFGGGWFGNDTFDPFRRYTPRPRWQQRQAPAPAHQDFSKAPPPEKREAVPQHRVLVLGDAMADWLASGLEDAYSDQPDMGVIRRNKTISGLIRYQPKGAPADWATAAKGILAKEKPDAIVVILGLGDRMSIREPAVEKINGKPATDKQADKKDGSIKSDDKANVTRGDKSAEAELSGAPTNAERSAITPAKRARTPNGVYEFRDERWIELYNQKIDEMIGVLKSKGVPVVWVGLPAVRGATGIADALFLDALYRNAAGKAGITYVDVWDGFVDDAGRFLQKGPDVQGQIRELRTTDGVYFTKAGARKLAHYVEREIARLLAARSAPVALPTEPAPDANLNKIPGQPAPRPLAGPIVPLVAPSTDTDKLLGGPGSPPTAVDALAAKTMAKGEALTPPAGRADDFTWPRREVAREQAADTNPAASPPPDRLRNTNALMTHSWHRRPR